MASSDSNDKSVQDVKEGESSSADLQFLTFTNFSQTTDAATRRKVRSHVMHGVQQNLKRGKPKERKGEIVLDISALPQATAGPSRQAPGQLVVSNPRDLGAGSSDPFSRYPIEMDVRSHELFAHLNAMTCPMLSSLCKIGFFQTIQEDEGGFRQVLCTASEHQTKFMEMRDFTVPSNPESLALSIEAVRSINRRIADPVLGTSDGVIATIIAFACHTLLFNDVRGSLTHLKGLEEVVRRRGGLDTFGSNPVIPAMLHWIDVNVAFVHDRVPRFPVSDDFLPRIAIQALSPSLEPLLLEFCSTDDMVSAINELLALNQYVINELNVRDVWAPDALLGGLYVVPVVGRFLSVRHDLDDHSQDLARNEALRIGALLYLAGIRSRCRMFLVPDVYIPKLKHVISILVSNLDESRSFLLWLLVIGGLQSLTHEDHNWFVSSTAEVIVRMQLQSWDELMIVVRGLLWVEGIFEVESYQFRTEVFSEALNSYGHFFS